LSQGRAFTAIYTSVAVSYLGVGLVAPLIAIVLAEHGADSVVVGLVGTTMFATFTASSFPIGQATDRIGPKPVLFVGLAIYAVSILMFAFIDSTLLFFVVRGIEGIGAAGISVATETMISKLSAPKERARRMSYYGLSVGLGWAAGPLTGALLFGIRPELPFVACFVLSLASAGLVAAFIPHMGSSSHRVKGIFTGLSRQLVVPVSAGALYGYLMSSLVTLFPLYLKELGVKEEQMGTIITAVIAGTILSQVPIGRAADRFGKRATIVACAVALSGIFGLMTLHTSWQSFLVTGALAGAMAGSFYPVGLAMIGSFSSADRLGAATSLFSLAFGIGSLTGPAISGLAMSHFGNRWLFYLPSILILAFVVEALMFGTHESGETSLPEKAA
jgi:MFS family permease